MNKIIKNACRILFVLLLVFSVFKLVNVFAENIIFKVTKIEVKEKSDKVTVNDVSLSGGQLINDIVFSEKDDYIKYNITIKNTTSDGYIIKSISDDNMSPYLEYTCDGLSNVKLEAGEEKAFELQIKYIVETNNLTISDQSVRLTITYEKTDGTTGTETITNDNNDKLNVINPKTGDNITTYIVLGIISLVGLVITTVNKKYLSKSLMAITVFSLVTIPLGIKADSDSFQIVFASNKIENSYTNILSGQDFRDMIYDLSNSNSIILATATTEQFNEIKDYLDDENIVSTSDSNVISYLWFDSDEYVIYYYTPSRITAISGDCSEMFKGYTVTDFDFTALNTSKVTNMSYMFNESSVNSGKLDLSSFDTSNVTSMEHMFDYGNFPEIDLSSFNTSNVTNMQSMFAGSTVNKLDLSNFNTSNVTKMQNMFDSCSYLEEVDLSSFNTSKVSSFTGMFSNCSSLKELDLSSFNTENVTEMGWMFYSCSSLEDIDLSSFNTENVTAMDFMFHYCQSLETLDVSMFNTSNVTDMQYMFGDMYSLKTIYVSDAFTVENLENEWGMLSWDMELVGGAGTHYTHSYQHSEYARIDDPDNGKPGYFTDIKDKPSN